MRVLFILALILLSACTQSTNPGIGGDFAIYRLQDTILTAAEVWDKPLDHLVLASTPFLTVRDVISYKWSTHGFTVTASVDSQLAAMKLVHGFMGGIPFVVVAGGQKIYLGAFWYAYSSMIPQVPYIDVILDPHTIHNTPSVLVTDDKRTDERIYRALQGAGVLIE